MAQSAVSAIKTGCQMLSEGRAEIASFKKTIESGVSDARALYEDVLGLCGWVVRLFQPKQTKAVAVVASAPKKIAKQPTTYEELKIQATNNICESLKTFFEIKRKLKEMCLELEEQSLTTDRIEDLKFMMVSRNDGIDTAEKIIAHRPACAITNDANAQLTS